MRKARNRRFGVRKPPSKLKRKEMAKLREISMRLGGAQYFKKRFNEAAHCQVVFHRKKFTFKISKYQNTNSLLKIKKTNYRNVVC